MLDLDKDNNGVIDYTEFLTAAVNKYHLLSKDNLKTAFNMIDTDGSGYITIDELKVAFDINQGNEDKIYKQIMNEVDKNHDGLISFSEFSEVMSKCIGSNYKNLEKLTGAVHK